MVVCSVSCWAVQRAVCWAGPRAEWTVVDWVELSVVCLVVGLAVPWVVCWVVCLVAMWEHYMCT